LSGLLSELSLPREEKWEHCAPKKKRWESRTGDDAAFESVVVSDEWVVKCFE
jgi:hypothetical protein